jgi:hypothetical protein
MLLLLSVAAWLLPAVGCDGDIITNVFDVVNTNVMIEVKIFMRKSVPQRGPS